MVFSSFWPKWSNQNTETEISFCKCGDRVAARGVRGAPDADDALGKAAQPGLSHREGVRRYGAANVSNR